MAKRKDPMAPRANDYSNVFSDIGTPPTPDHGIAASMPKEVRRSGDKLPPLSRQELKKRGYIQ